MRDKRNLLVTTSTFPLGREIIGPRFVYDLSMHLSKYFNVTVLVPCTPGAPLADTIKTETGTIDVIRYRYAPLRSMETLAVTGAIMPNIKAKPFKATLVPLLLIGLFIAVKKQLKTKQYDCIHAHWFVPQGLIQSLISNRKAPPFIVTGHGGDVWGLNGKLCMSLKRIIMDKASAITVVSDSMKEKLLSLPGYMATNSDMMNIKVVPMGCDVNKFSPVKRRQEFFKDNYEFEGTIILYVGRLAEKKGVIYLIEAMDHELIRRTDAKMIIAGDGPLREYLEGIAKRLGLHENIKFIGMVSHEQLSVLYTSSDIFCSPSIVARNKDREGFLTTNIEASASGLPVVTTAITESCLHNYTGYVVEQKNSDSLAQALSKLISDGNERRRLGENGVAWAQQFSWDNIAARYAGIINEVLDGKRTF